MIKMEFTQDEINELYHEFMNHLAGTVKKKLHVAYLKSLGLPHQDIVLIARVSADTVTRYLQEYSEGGLPAISIVRTYSPTSKLLPHQEAIKTCFQGHPPHTVAEAVFEIEKLTGIKLGLSACREFMQKHLGMYYRKMSAIPAKADPERQESFLKNDLEPLLEEERKGKGRVFFVDAAHFVMGAFLGMVWCFKRLFLKSSSGRKRYNVIGAYSHQDTDLITLTDETYINSDTIVKLLIKIKQAHPDEKVTLVMDNARYQRCKMKVTVAQNLKVVIPDNWQSFFSDVSDSMIYFSNDHGKMSYRLITFCFEDEYYRIATNRTDLTTGEIIMLYAYRWQIELFFRSIKRTFSRLAPGVS